MSIRLLKDNEVIAKLQRMEYPHWEPYLAMYSTWLGGIVQSPRWMMVPVDDHMVHRGDAVFEAFKAVDGRIYLLNEHLERLERSAKAIHLKIPLNREEIIAVIKKLVEVAGQPKLIFRLYLSRGPGGFTTNPYESIGAQLYIVATKASANKESVYQSGVKVARSEVPMKDDWLATVKSCNYLPNVLMKKEAIDRGVDFTVNFDPEYGLGEGSTENIALVTAKDELIFPPFDKVLRGTTLSRLEVLAKDLVTKGLINHVGERSVGLEDIRQAKEMFMVGTTLDVLPVTEFDGQKVGSGQVGPVAKACLELIRRDQEKD